MARAGDELVHPVTGERRLTVAGTSMSSSPDRDRRAAQLAVLARAVRDDEVVAADALRVIRHEL